MNLLLDSTLNASILLGVAIGATMCLRAYSASLRHWVLAVAVACALAAPALAFVLPVWELDTGSLLSRPPAHRRPRPRAPSAEGTLNALAGTTSRRSRR